MKKRNSSDQVVLIHKIEWRMFIGGRENGPIRALKTRKRTTRKQFSRDAHTPTQGWGHSFYHFKSGITQFWQNQNRNNKQEFRDKNNQDFTKRTHFATKSNSIQRHKTSRKTKFDWIRA